MLKQERIEGGLIGLLVGDALGVPYEFNPPNKIPALAEIELDPPVGFVRTYPNIPIGTWSDDGAQALCLLASLLECGKLDPEDLGDRFLRWYDEGYMAVDRHVFDVGNQTHRSLTVLRSGKPALEAGAADERSQGNGSLMRVLPLVLWHSGTDAELVTDAQNQSRITHGHEVVQICCALYCLWGRQILEAVSDPWGTAVAKLRQIYANNASALTALDAINPEAAPHGQGTGYVVDCLHSARLAMQAGSYEQVVKAAIALGNDTDTTACVAGGIAGLRDGINAIPDRWQHQLRGQDIVQPLMQQLLSRSSSQSGSLAD